MQVPLEISTRWIDLSPPLEAELRKRADRLERHSDRITSCRIAVERPTGNHHQEGGPYRVRVDVTVCSWYDVDREVKDAEHVSKPESGVRSEARVAHQGKDDPGSSDADSHVAQACR